MPQTLQHIFLRLCPDAVVVINRKQQIVDFNEAAKEIFGFERDEILLQPLDVLIPEDLRKQHRIVVDGYAAANSGMIIGESRSMANRRELAGVRKDGTVFAVDGWICSFVGEDGEPLMAAVLRDITDRKKDKDRLERALKDAAVASQAKSDFVAHVSHEVRTPLNSILGFSELMALEAFGPVGDARYKQYADSINEAGKHLLHLINEILDLSKLENGRMTMWEEEVDLCDLVTTALGLVSEQANKGGIALQSHGLSSQIMVKVDATKIRQVLLNLLSNAIKFTPRGGTISVSVSLGKHSGVEVSVRDTGIGIAPDDIEKVLMPFGQVDNAESHTKGGTGLGVPLSKALTELHQGRFAITSRLGEGTEVAFWLPPARLVPSSDTAEAAS